MTPSTSLDKNRWKVFRERANETEIKVSAEPAKQVTMDDRDRERDDALLREIEIIKIDF